MSEPEKKTKPLTEAQRVARVFVSQGRAPGLAAHLSADHRKRLAALCNADGFVSHKAPTEFAKVLREIIDDQKASVQGLEENDKEQAPVKELEDDE